MKPLYILSQLSLTASTSKTNQDYACLPVIQHLLQKCPANLQLSRLAFLAAHPTVFSPSSIEEGIANHPTLDSHIVALISPYFWNNPEFSPLVDHLWTHWILKGENHQQGLSDLVMPFNKEKIGSSDWISSFSSHLKALPNILLYIADSLSWQDEKYDFLRYFAHLLPSFRNFCTPFNSLDDCFKDALSLALNKYNAVVAIASRWTPFNGIMSSGDVCSLQAFEFDPKPFNSGSFGLIYGAKLKRTGQAFAVKYVPFHKMNENNANQIVNEDCLQSRKTINHPNILAYECSFKDKHHSAFFVMKRLIDDSLAMPPKAEDSPKFMAQIMKAVNYLHRNGIIHRDLKPENFLFDEQGNAYIADFGLAIRLRYGEKAVSGDAGSLPYAAPEILAQEAYGIEVDYWSLGLSFYAILHGVHPFKFDGRLPTLKKFVAELKSGRAHFNQSPFPNFRKVFNDLTLISGERRVAECFERFDRFKQCAFFKNVNWDAI